MSFTIPIEPFNQVLRVFNEASSTIIPEDSKINALFTFLRDFTPTSFFKHEDVSTALFSITQEESDSSSTRAKLADLALTYFNAKFRRDLPPPTIEKLTSLFLNTDEGFLTPLVMRAIIDVPQPRSRWDAPPHIEPAIIPFYHEPDETSACLLNSPPKGLNEFPFYPLMLRAVKLDDTALVCRLRSMGLPLSYASMCNGSSSRLPAIFIAARSGSLNVIELFKELGEKIDEPYKITGESVFMTPLVFAIRKAKFESVQKFLELGASLKFKVVPGDDCNHKTPHPLFEAVYSGDRKIIELVFSRYKSPLLELDENGENLAQAVASRASLPTFNFLTATYQFDFTQSPGPTRSTPLLLAARHSRPFAVEWIGKRCPETLETRDSEGRTPAIVAVQNNDIKTLKALANLGADLEVRWKEGQQLTDLANRNYPFIRTFLESQRTKRKERNS